MMMRNAVGWALIAGAVMLLALLPACRTTGPASRGVGVPALTNEIGMEFVAIPAGEFMMGSPAGETGRDADEGPRHLVRLTRDYYLGAYEVTVGQFRQFVNETGYRTEAERGGGAFVMVGSTWRKVAGTSWRSPNLVQDDDHPVTCVSWNDAQQFCAWLSRRTGDTYRLPTEAEWEYACRAGTTTRCQWGDNDDDGEGWCNAADATVKRMNPAGVCFAWDDRYLQTSPVGSFRANDWGLYDMHGNVWEWCADRYGADYYRQSPANNPAGPATGANRVARGASFINIPDFVRSANRRYGLPSDRGTAVGFRVLRPLP